MASTEEDRDKAIALTALLPAVGLLAGFLINAGTSYMKYPGIEIPLIKIHLNLFTAPMIFSMFIFLFALYLLIYHFDGKWHIYEKMQKINKNKLNNNNIKNDEKIKNGNKIENGVQCWVPNKLNKFKQNNKKDIHAESNFSFDWIAVLVCCYTQLVMSMAMLNLLTISPPYQQLAFQWDASQLQFYGGLTGAAVAFQLILWPSAYMIFGLNKLISERQSVMLGLTVLIGGYLLTYSWPFLAETFPYAINSTPYSFLNNKTEIVEKISNCGSESHPGCPSHYDWCGTTTKPNMQLYITSLVLSTGMAIPIIRMNLDILYSKILGNIKQAIF
uniref:MFS domain-containing protein n=1 Tax=Meloidogyne hapla TaxID=6305 RepID=A0A1I8B5R0_MELHA